MTAEPAGPGPAGADDGLASLEAELVAAALDGAEWPALLARLAGAAGRPARLLGMDGRLLASASPPGPGAPAEPVGDEGGSTALAVAALLLAAALGPVISPALGPADAPLACRDGWRGHGAVVRMGRRYLGAVLLEARPAGGDGAPGWADPAQAAWAARLAAAAGTALAIVALRREAHAAALARRVDVVLDDIRHGAIRPAAEFVRVAESFGLDVRIPHAGVALRHLGPDEAAWAAAWAQTGQPVLRDGDRAWTLLSGDVSAELGRLLGHLAYQLGSARAVLAAAGPVVPGEPADPAETAASFRVADSVLAMLAASHQRDPAHERTMLLYDELGLERLLLTVPQRRLRGFAERALAGLDRNSVELLTAWLETDGSLEAVAARLATSPARLRRRLAALVNAVNRADAASTDQLTVLHTAAARSR